MGSFSSRYCLTVRKLALFKSVLPRSEEHTSELQSRQYLVCRLLLEKKEKDFLQAHRSLALLPVLISSLMWFDLVSGLPLMLERILVLILLRHFLGLMLGILLVLMFP